MATFLVALDAALAGSNAFGSPERRTDLARELGIPEFVASALTALDPLTVERGTTLAGRCPRGARLTRELVFPYVGSTLFEGILDRTRTLASPGRVVEGVRVPVSDLRFVAEATVRSLNRRAGEITLLDPASGAGSFIVQTLLALKEYGFQGRAQVIGRESTDVAALLAKVAAVNAQRLSALDLDIDITSAEAADEDSRPTPDVLLLTPRWRPWTQMNRRIDPMAIVIRRAIATLRPGGVLAAFVPRGLLAGSRFRAWRRSLLELADPVLVAALSEHRMPLVPSSELALVVLRAREREASQAAEPVTSGAASDGRRKGHGTRWRHRPSWLPSHSRFRRVMAEIEPMNHPTVGELFSIHGGARTSDAPALLLSHYAWDLLPVGERQYFAPVVDSSCVVDGSIQAGRFLFDPPLEWSEVDVRRHLPRYFAHYLNATRGTLTQRRGIVEGRWWAPAHERAGDRAHGPRLIGKRHGLVPAFAMQRSGDIRVVEANAWRLRTHEAEATHVEPLQQLRVYWWILNSRLMQAIFRGLCPEVARGQLDFSRGYIRHVPMPSVATRIAQQAELLTLAEDTTRACGSALPPMRLRDEVAANFFGCEQELSGLLASE